VLGQEQVRVLVQAWALELALELVLGLALAHSLQ